MMRQLSGSHVLVGLATGGLLALVGLPLLFLLLQAVFPGFNQGSFAEPFRAFGETLSDPALFGLTRNTVLLGATVVAGTLVLAGPVGILRAVYRVPGAAAWDVLFLVPFMIPPYIAALAWVMTLQPGGYLEQLAGVHAGGFLFSFWGVAFVMVLNLFPLTYFAVSRTVAAVGQRHGAVARVFGAPRRRAFLRVTAPLCLPGVAASQLLVFVLTIEEFGTPATLAAQSGFHVLVTGIHRRFADWPIDIPGAAVLSTVLVVIALGAYVFQHRLVTRRDRVAITGKPVQPQRAEPGRWHALVLAAFTLVGLVGVALPLLGIIVTALTRTISGGLAPSNLSLTHFRTALEPGAGALGALLNSLGLATATALVTAAFGMVVAYCVVRTPVRGRTLLDALAVLPNAIPGIVVAVGLVLVWNQSWWPVPIYNTPAILLVAYCCLLIPYPVRYAGASLRQTSVSLEQAGRVSGAGLGRTLVRIVLPSLLPSVLVAMLLVFAVATRELVASIILTPPGMHTVATYVFRQFEQGAAGVGMALSVIAIFSTTALVLFVVSRTRVGMPA